MRRETRDARRETRDARRETRDARRETEAHARLILYCGVHTIALMHYKWRHRMCELAAAQREHGIVFTLQAAFLSLMACTASEAARGDEPRLDGVFNEWTAANLIATDPVGDATGSFDVSHLYALNRGTRLFLRFDIATLLNLQSGDAANGTLCVEIGMPNSRSLTIDLRNRSLWRDGDSALAVTWAEVSYNTAPTFAASEFELSADLSMFGVVLGSPITLNFSSSDSLAASANFIMSSPSPPPVRRSTIRPAGTLVRVASLNTLVTGFLDPTRGPKLLRLVDAVNADIYCFQEEYSSTAAQVDAQVTSVDPMEDGANWNVHKDGDCVIASRSPLLALPSPNFTGASAIVDLPAPGTRDAVVVFSIHPTCCGYIGSSQDASRIAQMNALVSTLNNLRAGVLGPAFEPYRQVPAIIIGDWNLVGSRTPLDIVLNPAGPHMMDAVLPQLIGEDVTTWRSTNTSAGSFSPGRLDLFASSSEGGFRCTGSFILDSARLNAAELSALALEAGDSAASDHLMFAGDFAFAPPCRADLNGSGTVDGLDLTGLLSAWGSGGSAAGNADINADGIVDGYDLTVLLSGWGECP